MDGSAAPIRRSRLAVLTRQQASLLQRILKFPDGWACRTQRVAGGPRISRLATDVASWKGAEYYKDVAAMPHLESALLAGTDVNSCLTWLTISDIRPNTSLAPFAAHDHMPRLMLYHASCTSCLPWP